MRCCCMNVLADRLFTGIHEAKLPGLKAAIRKYKPNVACILAGTNDLLHLREEEARDGVSLGNRLIQLHKQAQWQGLKTVAIEVRHPLCYEDSRNIVPGRADSLMKISLFARRN